MYSIKTRIKITEEELQKIQGDDYTIFQEKIINNCWCPNCRNGFNATIINYTIILDCLNDILLEGFCRKCGDRINRILETGERLINQKTIEEIRRKYDSENAKLNPVS